MELSICNLVTAIDGSSFITVQDVYETNLDINHLHFSGILVQNIICITTLRISDEELPFRSDNSLGTSDLLSTIAL